MRKIHYVLTFLNLIGVAYLIFRLRSPLVNSNESILSNTDSIGVYLAMQANQFACLQVLLSVVGIAIAFAAIWGYITIKEGAEQTAEKAVKDALPNLFQEMIDKYGPEQISKMVFQENMKKSQHKDMNEEFNESIEAMKKDPMEVPHV